MCGYQRTCCGRITRGEWWKEKRGSRDVRERTTGGRSTSRENERKNEIGKRRRKEYQEQETGETCRKERTEGDNSSKKNVDEKKKKATNVSPAVQKTAPTSGAAPSGVTL